MGCSAYKNILNQGMDSTIYSQIVLSENFEVAIT